MVRIFEGGRQRIIEHGDGLIERDPVLHKVGCCFVPAPFESHDCLTPLLIPVRPTNRIRSGMPPLTGMTRPLLHAGSDPVRPPADGDLTAGQPASSYPRSACARRATAAWPLHRLLTRSPSSPWGTAMRFWIPARGHARSTSPSSHLGARSPGDDAPVEPAGARARRARRRTPEPPLRPAVSRGSSRYSSHVAERGEAD